MPKIRFFGNVPTFLESFEKMVKIINYLNPSKIDLLNRTNISNNKNIFGYSKLGQ